MINTKETTLEFMKKSMNLWDDDYKIEDYIEYNNINDNSFFDKLD